MLGKLLLLFTIGPLIELYVLIEMGKRVGTAPTIILVVSTGFFGVFLARQQGFLVLSRITGQLRSGELPGDELLNGVLVLIGAAFLLTPGLITDTVGFLLLIPVSRHWLKGIIRRKLERALKDGTLWINRR